MGKKEDQHINFTDNRLSRIKNETDKRVYYYDTGCPGLELSITPGGTKTLRLNYWDSSRKKSVIMTIGRYPKVKINTARDIIRDKIQKMSAGVDVKAENSQVREESKFDDLFQAWLDEHAKENIKNWQEDERRYKTHIKPYLGHKTVASITADTIMDWRRKLLKTKKQRGEGLLSKGFVHRLFIIVSSVYGIAAPRMHNPCSEVKGYPGKKRDVFLKTDHLKKFFDQLYDESTPEYLRDFLLLSLATGARRSNLLAMLWSDVDLSLRVWIVPGDEVKNKEPMAVPLIGKAVEILERKKKTATSVFVFPSRKSKTGHLVEPKRAWKTFLKDAGLPTDYRFHDIRRTMGSWQAISGTSSDIIGKSLGHRSKQATEHYAHLILDPVRAAMQGAFDKMEESRELEKVVKIRKEEQG